MGDRMSDLPHPREILRGLEQRARRRFGQNFLIDEGMASAIVAGAGVSPGDRVVEIGPGLGMLPSSPPWSSTGTWRPTSGAGCCTRG
jgi:hypothetical protein